MTSPINKKCSLLLILFAFSLTAAAGDSLPSADDINVLSKKAQQISNSFFSQTFTIRMQYEYSGRFLNPQDNYTLCKAAQQASAELEQIANDQNNLKYKIENYQDDDWEARFGQTGLWRKLAADFEKTKASKLELDSYSTITDGGKAECLHFAAHGRCDAIKASMEKIRCFGQSQSNELNDLAGVISKSDCYDDPETLLSLAILQNKYAPHTLQNTLSHSSQTAHFLGKIILADLSSGTDPNLLNPAAAEVAAYSVWTTDPVAYKKLILALTGIDKFKTPMVLYAAGAAIADSSPEKAVKLLIEASTLQNQQKDMFLDIEAGRIAEQAARLAYDNFTQNKIDCNLAIAAFENYAHIDSNKMTEEMWYLNGEILLDCGKTQEASQIFTKLADVSKSIWREKASFQLLKIKINAGQKDAIPQLRNLILNCTGQDNLKLPLRLEAMYLYCQSLLDKNNNDSASQVMTLLDTAEQTPGFWYDFCRAQALRQLGRLEESAHFMSKTIIFNSGSMAYAAEQIVSGIVDNIELWQQDANDYNQMLIDCNTLSEFANKSIKSRQTGLVLAEIYLLQGKDCQELFSSDENDAISLRVQARLLMAQNKFEQSAKLWARIAEIRRNDTAELNQKSYGWWQAKFYELDCLAKMRQPDKKSIRHAIEVLQNSYPKIPSPWAEKLDLLKRQCSAN